MGDAELTGDVDPRPTRLGDVRADLEPVTYRDHRCRNAFGSVLAGLLAARLAACSDVGSVGIVEAPILLVAGSR